MSPVILYIIFATSIAISACYEIMRPALYQLRNNKDDVLTQHKFLAYISMFVVSWITAPFSFFVIFVPTLHSKVIQGIVKQD